MLCQQTEEVRVLNARTHATVRVIPVGRVPRGMALSATGDRLFVTNSWDDTLSVIDTKSLAVIATWNVGAEPSGVVEDRAGNQIFVANRISNDIAVLDARTGVEKKRLMAGRGASYLTLSPDGKRIYATHVYPNATPHRTAPESEITVIDTERAVVVERVPLHDVAGVFHLAISSDGRLGAVAEYHPKNLVPLAHLEHGGAFAYTLTLFGADVGKPVEIPLDELERYSSHALRRRDFAGQVEALRDGGRIRERDRHRCGTLASLRSYAPAPSFRIVCRRPFSERKLHRGAHSGWAQSPRFGIQPRWPQTYTSPTGSKTRSASSTRARIGWHLRSSSKDQRW